MAGVHAAAEYQRTCAVDRVLQKIHTHTLKAELVAQGLPVIPNRSHIIPLFVGDAKKVKTASDLLLRKSHLMSSLSTIPRSRVGWRDYGSRLPPGTPETCKRS
jgi:5-aminolevulinate synthase